MWGKLKGVALVGIFIGISLVGIVLAFALIKGGAWLGEMIYPFLTGLSFFTLVVLIFILFPLSFIRRTYGFSATGILVASYVFGVGLWVWAMLLTYHLWGGFAVFVGLFLMGIGVVPVAMAATLFNGLWSQLGQLVLMLGIVIALRMYSGYVAQKADKLRDTRVLNG